MESTICLSTVCEEFWSPAVLLSLVCLDSSQLFAYKSVLSALSNSLALHTFCVVCNSNIPETPPTFQMPKYVRCKRPDRKAFHFIRNNYTVFKKRRDLHPSHNEIMMGKKAFKLSHPRDTGYDFLQMFFIKKKKKRVDNCLYNLSRRIQETSLQLFLGKVTCCISRMQRYIPDKVRDKFTLKCDGWRKTKTYILSMDLYFNWRRSPRG